MKINTCDGCRFCCWSFNVDVPHQILKDVLEPKLEMRHCNHECLKGCSLHGKKEQPDICSGFVCPYLWGEKIHKPGIFQGVIESMNGNMGNFIPAISDRLNIKKAIMLMNKLRAVPSYIMINGTWVWTILPMDKNKDGGWGIDKRTVLAWNNFYKHNAIRFPKATDKPKVIEL